MGVEVIVGAVVHGRGGGGGGGTPALVPPRQDEREWMVAPRADLELGWNC